MRAWVLVAAAALAGCKSQTMERDMMGGWKNSDPQSSNRGDPPPQQAPPPDPKKLKVVEIPPDVGAAYQEFSARASTIFSDVVEIDLSQHGWLHLMSITLSPDAVSRDDKEDPARGVLTITITRLPGVAATPDAVPTIRFGDGLRVVGVDRVVLRFWAEQSAERPFWFHAVAVGKKAFYEIEGPPAQEWHGRSVDVRSEVHRVGESWRFDWTAEGAP